MKKLAIFSIIALLFTTSVQAQNYPYFGLVNEGSHRSSKVCYDLSFGSVLIGVVFAPTVIVPAYIVGWHLMRPVRLRQGPNDPCYGVLN